MNRLLLIGMLIFLFTTKVNGQSNLTELQHGQDTIKIYVDEKSKIILNGTRTNLTQLDKLLQTQQTKYAKFGTIFPTPLKVFRTVEQVNSLLTKYHVPSTWYKDPEFTKLAFD
jgi:hypothetical protein